MIKVLGTATIRPRGEITIPKEVRKQLGFKEGDRIIIVHEEGKIVIKKAKTDYLDIPLQKLQDKH